MANYWRPSTSLWMCCCVGLSMASLVVRAAEFQMFSHYKDDSRLENALNSAEFISANGIPNHIGSAVPGSPFSGNGQTNAGMSSSSYGLMADERTVFETYTMATVNHTYTDHNGEEFQLTGENNAKFGEGRLFATQGKLVHVTSAKDVADNTACHPNIRGTAGQKLPTGEPWIALVKRGVCKFEDKVKHAYLHNAIAVIVYNDRESLSLDKMQIVDKERNITAVFTYKRIGEQLAGLLDKGFDVTTSISQGQTITKQYQNMNRTSVLFVSISFIILMIISLVWLVFYYVQRFRYLQSKDKQSRRMCNVAKRIIAKIPTKSVRTEDKELQNECCPICIEQYRVSDLIRVLPCKHEFHKNCIDPWLLDHRLCPMCKMDILKYYGFVFTGSQESILQMDLDVGEDEELEDTRDSNPSRGISPLPQIRPSERMLSRSSSLNSDIQIVTETTPSLADHYEGNRDTAATAGHQRQNENHQSESASTSTAALLRSSNLQPYTDDEPVSDNYQKSRLNNNSSCNSPPIIMVQIQMDDDLHPSHANGASTGNDCDVISSSIGGGSSSSSGGVFSSSRAPPQQDFV